MKPVGARPSILEVDREPVRLDFGPSRVVGVLRSEGRLYTLCLSARTRTIRCDGPLWVLPEGDAGAETLCIRGTGDKTALATDTGVRVVLGTGRYELTRHSEWPACDVLGRCIELRFEGGRDLEVAFARFYWDTLLPSAIERTDAVGYQLSEGYVVSTLQPGEYAGTYPDVDHEFQTKGRLALRGECERALVERMLDLQFRLMREDPAGLWRNPCAVQPGGEREYHVRRDSLDRTANAEMFLVSGNVEVLETAWLHFAATHDEEWLSARIEDLEGAASLLEHLTDRNSRIWSDVFYEDQVIKDGAECLSAALAAHALGLLADLERRLGRTGPADRFERLSARIGEALVQPLPAGFWDESNRRFVDWIDRNGKVHDHIHLLANELPVLFGYASTEQALAVASLLEEHFAEFQRFPAFLSPRIADYTPDEIGSGGPYDLCAAGRYWCWDAAYWAFRGRGDVLGNQLRRVAAQARDDGYRMGERYDMDHVYYDDGRNWHGAPYYYEYPCVFLRVLMQEFLGFHAALDVDLELRPLLDRPGTVLSENHGVEYTLRMDGFTATNRSAGPLSLRLNLQGLFSDRALRVDGRTLLPDEIFRLEAGGFLEASVATARG